MEKVKVNSEELENYPIENFIDKFVYNNCKPGTGKTKKIHQILDYCVEINLKVMVCMPNHHLIEEFNENSDYNSVHLRGKDHYCPREGIEKYNPGCRECRFYCMYRTQKKLGEDRPIIFIVPQHLFFVEKYNPDVLIVDETIESIVLDCIEVPEHLLRSLTFHKIECQDCPTYSKCPRKDKGWKYGLCYSKLVKKPEINNNLSNNYINELTGLDTQINLIFLQLENNEITEIKELDSLTNLITLNLNNNCIDEIKGLQNLKNLNQLYLRGNQIDPELIKNLGGLNRNGCANYPKMFVKYCQENQ